MEIGTAPEFSQKLQPVQVAQSQMAVLECQVQGEPEPQIRWFKQGREVQEDARHKIEKLADGQQRLIIQQANETDIATYTCEARNLLGSSATSSSLMIKSN